MIEKFELSRPIGQFFKLGDVMLEVKEGNNCQQCYFCKRFVNDKFGRLFECEVKLPWAAYIGYCTAPNRKDATGVHFEKVLKPLKCNNRNEYPKKILQTRW